ncbi:helix-turn-helix domain-containing protein [Salinibacillus xinjiangensis]|uniref:Helix-turn-helix domain-containing protein n=1 Tax=Salinibacillus xinjiangensis TaxID=1229268 RepID=A0A6G1X577_9BACI|nr:hypothetical protein [Salinibacillus xinjiangensis]MRG86030.1 hypothetical protein [Salinibacillus xinjiangensis]
MNYIKEIKAFYTQIQTNPISHNANSLWHALMHVNNLTGWKPQFTVAQSVLQSNSGLSKTSFKRARNELVEKGYIHYRTRGGNRAPEISNGQFVVHYGLQ